VVRPAAGGREGRHDEARDLLEEARTLAERLRAAEGIVLTTARLALLSAGDAKAAVECFLKHEPRLKHAAKMEAHYLVWRLTNDPEHLREARRLLDGLREHAPEERKESILTRVPLNRAIVNSGEDSEG